MSGASAVGGLASAWKVVGRYIHCQEKRVYPWSKDQSSCFAAGTPLMLPDGTSRLIELFRAGDPILTRDEADPHAPATAGVVAEVFVRNARIWNVHVRGGIIETTAEHPFYVRYKGWVPAGDLRAGDEFSTSGGWWVRCDGMADSGRTATVYNLRVSPHHIYFVGCPKWGFDLWAHNTYTSLGRTSGTLDDLARLYVNLARQAHGVIPARLRKATVAASEIFSNGTSTVVLTVYGQYQAFRAVQRWGIVDPIC
jgi:hypothetical protein